MYRTASLTTAALLTAGCLFSGNEGAPRPSADAADDAAVGADIGTADARSMTDLGAADLGVPDLGAPDLGAPDVGEPDGGRPDMPPPVRDASTVCEAGVSSDLTGAHRFRLRTNTSDSLLIAAYVVPGVGADVLGHTWSQWETSELWVDLDFRGTNMLADEVIVPDPTGIAAVPNGGIPGAIVTRRTAPNCIYAESPRGMGSIACAGAWGAELANFPTAPVYFWFGPNGTISSMPIADFDPAGQRITVSWCAQNPERPTDCLPLTYPAVDARANRGPNVLLSDARGRAYLWDAVQNIDASREVDCVTPPTAPVPLMIQGMPVMFSDADVVRVGTTDYLVHQTPASVNVHPLDASFRPLPAIEQLPNSGQRPHFDAVSDGTRIAAVTAIGSNARIFAFGTGGGTRDVTIDDNQGFDATSVGAEILQNQVAVVAGGRGNFVVVANAFVMW